jgi:polar amino acid transport system substrate-binding protein
MSLFGATALGVSPLLSGCSESAAGANALEQLRKAGVAKVAYSIDPPYSFTETSGELTGMAVEIVGAVFEELGVPKLEGVLVGYSDLIPGLKARRFDTVGGSMFITPERCQEAIFSQPFALADELLAVHPGNPHGLVDFASVAANPKVRLGVIGGSSEIQYAKAAGVGKSQIVTFKDLQTAVEAAAVGRVDAAVYDAIGLAYTVKKAGGNLETTESFVAEIDGEPQFGALSYAFRPEESALLKEFDKAQKKLITNGRVKEICNKYVGDTLDSSIDRAQELKVSDLCDA